MAILFPTQRIGRFGLSLGFTYRLLHELWGFAFGEPFHKNVALRVKTVMEVDQAIFERYGALGLGFERPFPRISIEPFGHRFMPVMYGCECLFDAAEAPSGASRAFNEEELAALGAWTEARLLASEPVREVLDQLSQYKKMLADWPARAPESWTPMDYFGAGLQNLGSVMNTGASVQGQRHLLDYLANPDLVRRFYANITELMLTCMDVFPRLDGRPLQRVYLGNCSVAMISPEQYRACNFAFDRQALAHADARGIPFTLHQDSGVTPQLPNYAALGKLSGVDFGQDTDFARVAELFPGVQANCILFPAWVANATADQLRQELLRLMRVGRRFSAFSFSLYEIDPALGGDKIFEFYEIFQSCAAQAERLSD